MTEKTDVITGIAVSSLRMSVTVFGALIGVMACAGDGPGTYFNPSDGNAVASAAVVTNAVARRTVVFQRI